MMRDRGRIIGGGGRTGLLKTNLVMERDGSVVVGEL